MMMCVCRVSCVVAYSRLIKIKIKTKYFLHQEEEEEKRTLKNVSNKKKMKSNKFFK